MGVVPHLSKANSLSLEEVLNLNTKPWHNVLRHKKLQPSFGEPILRASFTQTPISSKLQEVDAFKAFVEICKPRNYYTQFGVSHS